MFLYIYCLIVFIYIYINKLRQDKAQDSTRQKDKNKTKRGQDSCPQGNKTVRFYVENYMEINMKHAEREAAG